MPQYPLNTAWLWQDKVTLIANPREWCAVFIVQGKPPKRAKTTRLTATPSLSAHKLVLAGREYPILWEAPAQHWPVPKGITTTVTWDYVKAGAKPAAYRVQRAGGKGTGLRVLIEVPGLSAETLTLAQAGAAIAVIVCRGEGTYLAPIKAGRLKDVIPES